jgi:phosphoglycerol transferase MdoB-like AlkP superfamily enzyme
LGVAGATAVPTWAAVPFLFTTVAEDKPPSTARGIGAFSFVLAVLCLPAVLPGARAFLSAVSRSEDVAPGLGLANFVLYRGAENEPVARVLFAGVPLIVLAAVAFVYWRLPRAAPEGRAALAVLLLLFLVPSTSPEAVAFPILLLALPFLRPEESSAAQSSGG